MSAGGWVVLFVVVLFTILTFSYHGLEAGLFAIGCFVFGIALGTYLRQRRLK